MPVWDMTITCRILKKGDKQLKHYKCGDNFCKCNTRVEDVVPLAVSKRFYNRCGAARKGSSLLSDAHRT